MIGGCDVVEGCVMLGCFCSGRPRLKDVSHLYLTYVALDLFRPPVIAVFGQQQQKVDWMNQTLAAANTPEVRDESSGTWW